MNLLPSSSIEKWWQILDYCRMTNQINCICQPLASMQHNIFAVIEFNANETQDEIRRGRHTIKSESMSK